MQRRFSELEYAAKKKVTRHGRFLGEVEAVTAWPALLAELEPFYPRGEGGGRSPIGLARMMRIEIAARPVDLGGGWQLRLLESGEEAGGGVFPPEGEGETALQEALEDAFATAQEWLHARVREQAHDDQDDAPGAPPGGP